MTEQERISKTNGIKTTFPASQGDRVAELRRLLAALFRANVLKMLKKEGRIDDSLIEKLLTWKHNSRTPDVERI